MLPLFVFITTYLTGFGQEMNLIDQLNSNVIATVNRDISPYETDAIALDANESVSLTGMF